MRFARRREDASAAPERWAAHPVAAFLLRCVVRLAPACAALGFSFAAVVYLPGSFTGRLWPGRVVLICGSLLVAVLVERAGRRLLPLAALLRLTLLFPDRAPSRLKVARRSRHPRAVAVDVTARSDTGQSDTGQSDTGQSDTAQSAERVLELLAMLTAHDSRTRGHCERVRVYADLMADQLRLSQADRDRLRWVALLHDIGKLQVDPTILNKAGRPSDREWAILRAHPEQGARLAAPLLEWLGEWSAGVVEHHERFDGTGYPRGLSGEGISRAGRALAIVDAFEVMTAARAYKRAMNARAARVELANCAGSHFDPVVVRSFLAISLPKLMASTGPLGLLAQTPLFSRLGQVAQQAPVAGGAVAATTASSLVAASLTANALAPGVAAVPASPPVRAVSAGVLAPPGPPRPSAPAVSSPGRPPAAPTSRLPLLDAPAPPALGAPAAPEPAPAPVPPPAPAVPPAPPPAPVPAVPDAPSGVAVTAGDQQARVSWTAPADNGSPITGYTVVPSDATGPLASTVVDASTTTATIAGLVNGTTYTFTVAAVNGVGTSVSPASAPATPAGLPGPPTAAVATAGDGQAAVSWSSSTDDGAPITSYTVVPFGPTGALPAVTAGGAQTSVTVPGLTNGATYSFVITARSAVGASPSVTSNAVVPAGVPGAPGPVTAVAGAGQASVFWSAPSGNGAAVTGYTVTPIGPGGALAPTAVPATASSAVIGGLTDGSAYTFSVTATNAVGTSSAAVSGAVTPAAPPLVATAPAAPLLPSAAAALEAVALSWSAPVDGGSPLTSYTVTAYDGAAPAGTWDVPPAATSFTAPGLTPGTPYTFTITATNAVGTSAAATVGPVTPVGVPAPVTGLTAVPGDGTVTLGWTAPTGDGGSALTGYTITPTGPSGPLAPISVAAGSTSATVSGLTNGSTYTFGVVATNAYGASSTVTSGPAQPAIGGPSGVLAVPDNASATVSWNPPASTAGITGYTVTAYAGGAFVTSTTVSAPQTAAIVNGLANGTAYTFSVVANGAGGSSQASAPSAPVVPTAVPGGVSKPPNPTQVQAVGGVGSATVSWTPPAVKPQGPVTSYLISVYDSKDKPTGQTLLVSGTTTSAVITGLTSGAQYRFDVQATNIAGTSSGAKTGNVAIG